MRAPSSTVGAPCARTREDAQESLMLYKITHLLFQTCKSPIELGEESLRFCGDQQSEDKRDYENKMNN